VSSPGGSKAHCSEAGRQREGWIKNGEEKKRKESCSPLGDNALPQMRNPNAF